VNGSNSSRFSSVAVTILVGGSLVLIIIGLRLLSFFVNTAFLAVIITITLTPLLNWLIRKGWPRGLATFATILLLMIGALVVLFFLVRSIGELSISLTTIREWISTKATVLDSLLPSLGVSEQGLISALRNLLLEAARSALNLIETLGSYLAVVALAVVAAMFMLFEAPNFTRRFTDKFGSNLNLQKNLNQFIVSTRNFIIVTTLIGLVGGVVISVALYILKVPHPITWGVLFWLLNYIPYLGVWLALIPPAFLAAITLGTPYGLVVIVIYLLVSNVIKVFIIPKFMGDKVNTSMTLGFLGIFFWGVVLGVFGMLLAYPYTLLVRDLLLTNTDETWLVDLMKKADSG
jgi:AI-2 transport protein TqsA